MKAKDFEGYSDEQLIAIRSNLGLSYNDIAKLNNLSEKIATYIRTENPQGGNTITRISRCIACVEQEALKRFFIVR